MDGCDVDLWFTSFVACLSFSQKRENMKKQGNEGRKVLKPSPNEEVC